MTASAAVTPRRLTLRTRSTSSSIVVGIAVALILWETAAQIIQATSNQGDRVVPSLVVVAREGFVGLSNYWAGGWGVDATAAGGGESITGALFALVQNSMITIGRVSVGLVLAIAVGLALGLLVSACRPVRLAVSGVSEVMRMLPALAMAPLFTLWFGANSWASITFIVFSVSFIVLLATANAVANLPPQLIDYPRTLGLHGLGLWTRVVAPAILPELRGSLVFGGLVAWTTVLASEMYGLQSGLGWMLADTLRFSLVDRMVVVAIVFSGMALVTMKLLGAVVNRLTGWRD